MWETFPKSNRNNMHLDIVGICILADIVVWEQDRTYPLLRLKCKKTMHLLELTDVVNKIYTE